MKQSFTDKLVEYLEAQTLHIITEYRINSFHDLIKYMILTPCKTLLPSGRVQCYAGRHRSIVDFCIAAKYNLKMDFREAFLKLVDWLKQNKKRVTVYYCPNVRRMVFSSFYISPAPEDSFLMTLEILTKSCSKGINYIIRQAILENL